MSSVNERGFNINGQYYLNEIDVFVFDSLDKEDKGCSFHLFILTDKKIAKKHLKELSGRILDGVDGVSKTLRVSADEMECDLCSAIDFGGDFISWDTDYRVGKEKIKPSDFSEMKKFDAFEFGQFIDIEGEKTLCVIIDEADLEVA